MKKILLNIIAFITVIFSVQIYMPPIILNIIYFTMNQGIFMTSKSPTLLSHGKELREVTKEKAKQKK